MVGKLVGNARDFKNGTMICRGTTRKFFTTPEKSWYARKKAKFRDVRTIESKGGNCARWKGDNLKGKFSRSPDGGKQMKRVDGNSSGQRLRASVQKKSQMRKREEVGRR